MSEIELIRFGWNNLNGFQFYLLAIDIGRFDGNLFGFRWGWKSYFIIDILFFSFEIRKPWYSKSND